MTNYRVLPVGVFRSADRTDCSNNGISAQFSTLYLIHPEGFMEVSEDDPRLIRVVTRHLFGRDYSHVEPVNPEHPTGAVGPMSGGNFVYTCDSRFPSSYPLSVHDRFETAEQYESMSR